MDGPTATSLLAFAEQVAPGLSGPDARDALDRIEARYDELLTAIDWFVEAERDDEALRLANALYRFWITSRRFDDGARWFERVLASGGGDERLRGRALRDAGFMPFWMGDDDRAADLFGAALAVGRDVDDSPLISQALGGLARVALRRDVPEARRLAHEAFAVSEAVGDEAGISNALHLLGVGAQIAGDLPEARTWMRRRLDIVRASGNEFLIASEASNLSMVERQLGDLDVAEALALEALEVEQRTGGRFSAPFAMSGLASIALERGDAERAAVLVGAVEAIMDATQMAWPPDERPHYERLVARLPEAMGSVAFEQRRAAGRAMTADDAIEFALEGTRAG